MEHLPNLTLKSNSDNDADYNVLFCHKYNTISFGCKGNNKSQNNKHLATFLTVLTTLVRILN